MNTIVRFSGRVFSFDAQNPAAIAALPTFAITAYTSYTGTRWWTDNYDDIKKLVSHPPRLQTCQKMTDAVFRGVSRAEATSNAIMLIGTFLNHDLTILAGIMALIAFGLTSWSSYQRSDNRHQYVSSIPVFDTVTASAPSLHAPLNPTTP